MAFLTDASKVIKEYILEAWVPSGSNNYNVTVSPTGNNSYSVSIDISSGSYSTEYFANVLLDFNNVSDVSDEYPDEPDMWFTANVDILKFDIDSANVIDYGDFYYYLKFVKEVRQFQDTMYDKLPSSSKEPFDFYSSNNWG